MKYQVFQDGKPADSKGYPSLTGELWKNSIFDSFEKAVKYAHSWAFPFPWEDINGSKLLKMELNVPVDMSMGEFPVMMEIREYKDPVLEKCEKAARMIVDHQFARLFSSVDTLEAKRECVDIIYAIMKQ